MQTLIKRNSSVLLIVLMVSSFVYCSFGKTIIVSPNFASITAKGGPTLKLTTNLLTNFVTFKSSNQLFVDSLGNVKSLNNFDAKNCNAWVVALNKLNGETDTCKISIVPWTVNLSDLTIDESLNGYRIIGKSGDSIRLIYNNVLYKMKNDFNNMIALSIYKIRNQIYSNYIKTPNGSFIRDGANIYFSQNDKNWTLDYTINDYGLNNSLAYIYDSIRKITEVFACQYIATPPDSIRCGVYKKNLDQFNTNSTWKKIIEFPSQYESLKNGSIVNACRHIHTIIVDPYTGHIWIGTGDSDKDCHLYYSSDNGVNWKQVGFGSQNWRTISIWFTKGYVYWSTDNVSFQAIFRIPRTVYTKHNEWPDMSQRVDSGSTKIGVRYYIQKSNTPNFIVGNYWVATYQQKLDSNLVLYSINDPKLNYNEKVIDLPNNALWDNMWVINSQGDSVLLLTTDAEGHKIDNRPRIFGIKERLDNTVDVQELISEKGNSDYSRFLLEQQGENNKIYLLPSGLVNYNNNISLQVSLNWNNNCSSKGGELINESIGIDSKNVVMKLIKYDGKIKCWQKANNTFNWSDISRSNLDGTLTDTISIAKEKNVIKYVRAIVQKENDIPVPSNYLKIDSLTTQGQIDSNSLLDEHLFICYPTVVSNKLIIHFISDSICNQTIELYTIDGILVYRKYLKYSEQEYQISLSTLLQGVYILKISGNNMVSTKKIIKN